MDWSLPPIWILIWWFLWLLLPFLSAWQIQKFRRLIHKQGQRSAGTQDIKYEPQVAVILPIKGVDDRFEANMHGLFCQKYAPGYRLIFVTQSDQDPAYSAIIDKIKIWRDSLDVDVKTEMTASPDLHDAVVTVAGLADEGGQKVWNQLHGIKHLDDRDEVVAFVDADAAPDLDWLMKLVLPLYKDRVGVSTGYRWMIPANGTLASSLASVMNATVATMADQRRRNMAWGGAMAIRQENLHKLGVINAWQGALSDDIQMTEVVKASGKLVYFVPRAMCASDVHFKWGSLFEFGRRQYLITRTHRPRAWWFAFIALGLYLFGWLSIPLALVMGTGYAIPMILLIYLMDNLRASARKSAIREAFSEQVLKELRGAMFVERWLTPLYMGVHWLLVVSAMFGKHITWGGVRYEINGPQDIKIIDRYDEAVDAESTINQSDHGE